jgi:hypothetical protein
LIRRQVKVSARLRLLALCPIVYEVLAGLSHMAGKGAVECLEDSKLLCLPLSSLYGPSGQEFHLRKTRDHFFLGPQ